MEPRLWSRSFAVGLPAPFRPCLRPFLPKLSSASRQASHSFRLGSAAGMAAAGMAAAGGLPPIQGALQSGLAASGSNNGGGGGGFGDPARRWTDILLVVNIAMYGLQLLTNEAVTYLGIKLNAAIVAGQYWRLMTPAFLHGGIVHLAVNCSSLNNLGPLLESATGRPRFVAAYLLAALAGNVASFLCSKNPSLGASGAIFGLGGALGVYFYRNKDLFGKRSDFMLRQLYQTLLMNLAYGFMNPSIDNWGHIGGMLGGALAAFLLGPHYVLGRLPGQQGTFLLDRPPLPLLSSKPRPVRG